MRERIGERFMLFPWNLTGSSNEEQWILELAIEDRFYRASFQRATNGFRNVNDNMIRMHLSVTRDNNKIMLIDNKLLQLTSAQWISLWNRITGYTNNYGINTINAAIIQFEMFIGNSIEEPSVSFHTNYHTIPLQWHVAGGHLTTFYRGIHGEVYNENPAQKDDFTYYTQITNTLDDTITHPQKWVSIVRLDALPRLTVTNHSLYYESALFAVSHAIYEILQWARNTVETNT
jgi:hypothetical protein